MLAGISRCFLRVAPLIQHQPTTLATASQLEQIHRRGFYRRSGRNNEQDEERNSKGSKSDIKFKAGAPLIALSWFVTLKDFLGIEKVQLDKDPIKDKIKQSWLDRKFGKFDSALQTLDEVLEEVKERGEELPITRVLDEIANTHYQKGDLAKAEEYFKVVIDRLMRLHSFRDSSKEFIGISLKLAEIFAAQGNLEHAETGFRHCLRKQMQVLDEHMKKYSISHGAMVEDRHRVEAFGPEYTDPIALFGMALEAYAHFLVTYRDEDRLKEAEEYMDEVMKIAYQIYGGVSQHTITLINNFGAMCIVQNRFELARKYLEIGIDRILHINEAAGLIPGYYCNYAEALWHTGNREKALEYAKQAVQLSKSLDGRTQKYCVDFQKSLQKDFNKGKGWWFW
ncbi:unnamed protein product, partial [Mesorhabditis belari]|uniref:Tetratricopeptide repeat protein 19 n=1 Tax=Mesorhabditis belari TaxID=2138241 RepID=A0AAF3J4G2_9BILA